jgi:hypothetical protein
MKCVKVVLAALFLALHGAATMAGSPDPTRQTVASTCVERCESLAREVRQQCLARGGSEEQCTERAREAFRRCTAERCAPPPTCVERCELFARDVRRQCLAAGGTEERCTLRAREAYQRCVTEHCTPE